MSYEFYNTLIIINLYINQVAFIYIRRLKKKGTKHLTLLSPIINFIFLFVPVLLLAYAPACTLAEPVFAGGVGVPQPPVGGGGGVYVPQLLL